MTSDTCLMHSLNRIVADHTRTSKFSLGTVFSLTKLLHCGSYFDTLAAAMSEEASSDPVWHQVGGAPIAETDLHWRLVNLCLPNLRNEPRRQTAVAEALQDNNGSWKSARGVHYCRIVPETGWMSEGNVSHPDPGAPRSFLIFALHLPMPFFQNLQHEKKDCILS